MFIIKKCDDTHEIWSVEIPADDPLWIALLDKYETAGYSESGLTATEVARFFDSSATY